MNTQTQTETVAVVCDRRGRNTTIMEAFLQARSLAQARWYAPPDLDDVDRAVRRGDVRRVVFGDLNGLLEGIWNGELEFEQWSAVGTQLEFVEPPGQTAPAHVRTVFASWQRWSRRRRRRQLVAGVVLSVVALAAAFVLNLPSV